MALAEPSGRARRFGPMEAWVGALRGDPRGWLLDRADPAVRHLALRWLEDAADDDPELTHARAAAMRTAPIAPILAAQNPEGWWAKPGSGYGPKYTGTTWSLIFLDQLGADGADAQIERGCGYLLDHAATSSGGLGMSGAASRVAPPSSVAHCLNGNLLRALIGFGWLDDPRVRAAIGWQARAITGEGAPRYYATATSGPGFACAANEKLPCAWGAVKAVLGLSRVPPARRSTTVCRALDAGVAFLLSVDPVTAAYPAGWGGRVSGSWFRTGFPSGYVADVLQVGEAIVDAGHARDARLTTLIEWILARQDTVGRWRNEYTYDGKLWADIERPKAESKWVTLRACRFLRAAIGD
jgi:hypothetical protein